MHRRMVSWGAFLLHWLNTCNIDFAACVLQLCCNNTTSFLSNILEAQSFDFLGGLTCL